MVFWSLKERDPQVTNATFVAFQDSGWSLHACSNLTHRLTCYKDPTEPK